MKKLLFLDLETTGVSITQDRIVQIAIAFYDNGELSTKKVLVNPTIPIPTEATEVHGITKEIVSGAPTFRQIATAMYDYIKDCDIAGFNSDRFDVPLIAEEFARCGIQFPQKETNFVDVMKLERLLNPGTLSAVYKRYTGQNLDGAHDALADVLATMEIFKHQINNFKLLDLYLDYTDVHTGETMTEVVDNILQGDKLRFDVAGNFYQKDGVVYWSFGKNKDKDVRNDWGYSSWYFGQDFPSQSKTCLRNYLNIK